MSTVMMSDKAPGAESSAAQAKATSTPTATTKPGRKRGLRKKSGVQVDLPSNERRASRAAVAPSNGQPSLSATMPTASTSSADGAKKPQKPPKKPAPINKSGGARRRSNIKDAQLRISSTHGKPIPPTPDQIVGAPNVSKRDSSSLSSAVTRNSAGATSPNNMKKIPVAEGSQRTSAITNKVRVSGAKLKLPPPESIVGASGAKNTQTAKQNPTTDSLQSAPRDTERIKKKSSTTIPADGSRRTSAITNKVRVSDTRLHPPPQGNLIATNNNQGIQNSTPPPPPASKDSAGSISAMKNKKLPPATAAEGSRRTSTMKTKVRVSDTRLLPPPEENLIATNNNNNKVMDKSPQPATRDSAGSASSMMKKKPPPTAAEGSRRTSTMANKVRVSDTRLHPPPQENLVTANTNDNNKVVDSAGSTSAMMKKKPPATAAEGSRRTSTMTNKVRVSDTKLKPPPGESIVGANPTTINDANNASNTRDPPPSLIAASPAETENNNKRLSDSVIQNTRRRPRRGLSRENMPTNRPSMEPASGDLDNRKQRSSDASVENFPKRISESMIGNTRRRPKRGLSRDNMPKPAPAHHQSSSSSIGASTDTIPHQRSSDSAVKRRARRKSSDDVVTPGAQSIVETEDRPQQQAASSASAPAPAAFAMAPAKLHRGDSNMSADPSSVSKDGKSRGLRRRGNSPVPGTAESVSTDGQFRRQSPPPLVAMPRGRTSDTAVSSMTTSRSSLERRTSELTASGYHNNNDNNNPAEDSSDNPLARDSLAKQRIRRGYSRDKSPTPGATPMEATAALATYKSMERKKMGRGLSGGGGGGGGGGGESSNKNRSAEPNPADDGDEDGNNNNHNNSNDNDEKVGAHRETQSSPLLPKNKSKEAATGLSNRGLERWLAGGIGGSGSPSTNARSRETQPQPQQEMEDNGDDKSSSSEDSFSSDDSSEHNTTEPLLPASNHSIVSATVSRRGRADVHSSVTRREAPEPLHGRMEPGEQPLLVEATLVEESQRSRSDSGGDDRQSVFDEENPGGLGTSGDSVVVEAQKAGLGDYFQDKRLVCLVVGLVLLVVVAVVVAQVVITQIGGGSDTKEDKANPNTSPNVDAAVPAAISPSLAPAVNQDAGAVATEQPNPNLLTTVPVSPSASVVAVGQDAGVMNTEQPTHTEEPTPDATEDSNGLMTQSPSTSLVQSWPPSPTPSLYPDTETPAFETFPGDLPQYTTRELDYPASPQSQAYSWLQDHPRYDRLLEWEKFELFALATLYYSLNNWQGTYQDTALTFLDYSTSSCQWDVVECNNNGRVRDIKHTPGSEQESLTGTVPAELEFLADLESISIRRSQKLDIEKMFPATLTSLSNLNDIHLMDFKGDLPGALLGSLVHLTSLKLESWSMSQSPLPPELFQLTSLETLHLNERMTGTIPSEFGLLSSVRALNLRRDMTGKIPSELGQMSKLERLELYGNELSGEIPSELGMLSRLTLLWLQDTNLSGTVPSSVCSLLARSSISLKIDCGKVTCSADCGCGCEPTSFQNREELDVAIEEWISTGTSQYGPIGGWDVSRITNFDSLFRDKTDFNDNISGWKVGHVTSMAAMFQRSRFNQNLSMWDVSKVETMHGMFASCKDFNGDISSWNMSKVTSLQSTFFATDHFNSDISNWDVSHVLSMERTFEESLEFNINIGGWDVSKVKYLAFSFQVAKSFNQDLTGWTLESVERINQVFTGALNFNQNLCSWNEWLSELTPVDGAFAHTSCPNPFKPTWAGTLFTPMCHPCQDLDSTGSSLSTDRAIPDKDALMAAVDDWIATGTSQYGPIGDWDVSGVDNFDQLFIDRESFNDDISGWKVGHVTSMAAMFQGTRFNQNLNSWDVSRVVQMLAIFNGCENFAGDVSQWNVSSVTSLRYSFHRTYKFNTDLSNWDVSRVVNMESAFEQSLEFNGNIGGWNVSQVTSLANCFQQAKGFNQDLSGWNVERVENLDIAFGGASTFNQNLCAWSRLLPQGASLEGSFSNTDCPNSTVPAWDGLKFSPMCYACK